MWRFLFRTLVDEIQILRQPGSFTKRCNASVYGGEEETQNEEIESVRKSKD